MSYAGDEANMLRAHSTQELLQKYSYYRIDIGAEANKTVSLKVKNSESILELIKLYAQYKMGSKSISTITVKIIGETWEVRHFSHID
jgi:hypothetical protein